MTLTNQTRRARFGVFDLDLQTGELRKSGVRIPLQDQPFKVLSLLVERPGELITREELKQKLWTECEFGDFDQGINVAIKKIRTALGDAPENPRFVETLARRGYRFIAPVTQDADRLAQISQGSPSQPQAPPRKRTAVFRHWTLVAAAALIVLALAAIILLRRPYEYSLGVYKRNDLRFAPLTSSLGYEFDPQFSPDGKQIVYAWSEGKAGPNIYLKVLGAGNPVQLVPRQENVFRLLPTWSPDGRFIAFLRVAKPPENPKSELKDKSSVAERIMKEAEERRPEIGVYLVPAVGGEEKKLFDTTFVSSLRWSPDGKWFLIGERAKPQDPIALYHYSADGSVRQRLTNPPTAFAGDTIPTFSPDGKLIAFSRNWTSGGSDIFVMPSTGGEPRQVTHDAHHLRGISFTADGKELIFSSARTAGAHRSLWRVPVGGGSPAQLSFGTDNVDSPVVARAGNHLAYVQVNESSKIWAYDIPAPGATPQEPKILIGSRRLQVGPQFSPDGKRLAFTSDRTGSWELWVSSADGSNPLQLTSFGDRQTGTPRWSPDGKLIVFDSRPEKHSDIFVIDSAGGKPRRITSNGFDNVVPSFSRDGNWIYYSSNMSGGWELWKISFGGQGSPVQVTHNGGFAAFESVDGKTLYYAKWDKPGIYSMPVSGGPETVVTNDLLPRHWGNFAVAEDGIYFLRPAQKPDTKELYPSLAFYNFSSKMTVDLRPLNEGPHPGPTLCISPDRKTLLYTQPDLGGSDIMIVENFR